MSLLHAILSKLLPAESCARCNHPRPRSAERCKVCGLARGAMVREAVIAEDATCRRVSSTSAPPRQAA